MKSIPAILLLVASAVLFAIVPWGCSDSDSPTGGDGVVDTAPPEVVSVTALDATHIEVVYNEKVEENSAEERDNYLFIDASTAANSSGAPAAPGDTLHVGSAVLGNDGVTVTTTLWSSMNAAPYDYTITGVRDLSGNAITDGGSGSFTGSAAPDETPPVVVSHVPDAGATGVGIGQTVAIEFSEAMDYNSVAGAITWTGGGGDVPYDFNADESHIYFLEPQELLQRSTMYTVTIGGGAMDIAGNHLTETSWTFRTTSAVDNTSPTLVSTTPADGATNVPVSTNIRLEFSEAIDPAGLENIIVTPEIGNGADSWSPDGSTITFDPAEDLADDTQYVFLFPQGSIRDLAGNGMEESVSFRFTTGANFPGGRIAGRLTGDAGTPAANPAGAVVLISSVFIFEYEEEGAPPIEGTDIAGTNGVYNATGLGDGKYWPVAIKETNGDGLLEPDMGDAVGAYGVNFDTGDTSADSVVVSEGALVAGIDFPLVDPSVIAGEVSYGGTAYADSWWQYNFLVGVFDEDPSGGGVEPIGGTDGASLGNDPDYVVHQFDANLLPGTYYVGAFLDINGDTRYDPLDEPGGFYMSGASPGTVTINNGSDAFGIDIVLYDPVSVPGSSSGWRIPPLDEKNAARAEQWRLLRAHVDRLLTSK